MAGAKKKGKRTRRAPRAARQATTPDGVEAIVEDAKKPLMDETAVRPRRIGRRIMTMPDAPGPSKVKKNVMAPVPKANRRKPVAPETLGDQVALETGASAPEGRGYFRFRMHMEDGRITLCGAKFVPGPFRVDEAVTPGITYEARVGRTRIAFGDVPDPTEWRSYPDPRARGERAGHHVTEQSAYDFTVRLPADRISERTLKNLRITLYRWRGRGPNDHIDIRALSKEPRVAVDKLGALSGVDLPELAPSVKKKVQQAFREAR